MKAFTTRDITYIGIFVALTAVMAQISIPMPLGVPMTMQTFAIILMGVMLGSKRSFVAAVVYLLLGAAGVPVFSQFRSGVQMLFGPTGGFLLTFPVMAFLIGLGIEKGSVFASRLRFGDKQGRRICMIMGLAAGMVFNYFGGMVMFSLYTKRTLLEAFLACVLPFLFNDIVKAVLGVAVGAELRRRLPQFR